MGVSSFETPRHYRRYFEPARSVAVPPPDFRIPRHREPDVRRSSSVRKGQFKLGILDDSPGKGAQCHRCHKHARSRRISRRHKLPPRYHHERPQCLLGKEAKIFCKVFDYPNKQS